MYVFINIYVYVQTNVSPDIKISNIIQTKPNDTVLFNFPKLSKPFIGYSCDIHKHPTIHRLQNPNFCLLSL